VQPTGSAFSFVADLRVHVSSLVFRVHTCETLCSKLQGRFDVRRVLQLCPGTLGSAYIKVTPVPCAQNPFSWLACTCRYPSLSPFMAARLMDRIYASSFAHTPPVLVVSLNNQSLRIDDVVTATSLLFEAQWRTCPESLLFWMQRRRA
jgi:hypothetical protein